MKNWLYGCRQTRIVVIAVKINVLIITERQFLMYLSLLSLRRKILFQLLDSQLKSSCLKGQFLILLIHIFQSTLFPVNFWNVRAWSHLDLKLSDHVWFILQTNMNLGYMHVYISWFSPDRVQLHCWKEGAFKYMCLPRVFLMQAISITSARGIVISDMKETSLRRIIKQKSVSTLLDGNQYRKLC